MAQLLTIARPYAKAVFEQALEDQQLEQWQIVLRVMSIVSRDARVQRLIHNPELEKETLEHFYFDITLQAIPNLSDLVKTRLINLLKILILEKRLIAIPDINILYLRKLAEHEHRLRVRITSAQPLTEKQQKAIEAALRARFKLNMTVHYSEDSELIGGAVIRSGNWVMDGSVKTTLARLRRTLTEV